MKKFIVLLLACVFIAGSAAGAFAVVYGSAGYLSEGYDESSAWEIDSVETLIKMRDDINNKVIDSTGKFYKLTADLDLTSYADWTPIGYDVTHSFKGNFNGNGHNIKIAIERASQENQQYIGLFGFGEGRITIKNLSVSGSINYVSSSQVCAGGIIAYLRSATIENCKFDGSITITGSSSSNKDGPAVYAGGIVGYTGSGTISSCKFDGAITILNCSASKENSAGGIVGYAYDSTKITNCSVGSKNNSTIIKSLYVSNSNNKTYAGGIVGYIVDSSRSNINGEIMVFSHGMEVTGNYSRLKTVARSTQSLTFGAIEKAKTAAGKFVTLGKYSDNTEVNPDDEPSYETTKWEIEDGNLTVQHTGSSSDLTFSPIDGTNGTGFKINGDFPEGLTIHLPANWELDVDDGAKVTASDTSRVKEAKDVDGLESPAVKIIGNNDITLNESGIIMTAWYVPSTPSAEIETTSWTKQGSKLIIETNGTPSRYEFDAITSPDTNGDGFKLTGFPSGLKINLPFTWGIDIDTSYNVTVSDESKIIPHTEIPGLPETAHRIMGNNTITLNASDLEMTAFLFTAPTITTDLNLGSYKAGDSISKQIEIEGTEWTLKLTAENLPEGLSMTSEGLISGSIKTAGTYKFTVKAENCAGSCSSDFTIRITSGTSETLKITTTSLTDATEGQPYSFQLEADGTNLTWSAKTKFPENLTLSQEGLISGTPTKAGTYRIIFTVKNSSGTSSSAALTLKVKSPSSSSISKPRVKTTKMPDCFIGWEYSYQLEAEGTVDEWKLADGSTLPGGLELNESTGEISGTVTESSAKTFKFKVIAVNDAGESKAQSVSIKVVAKTPSFKTEALKSATWSKSYSFTVRLANIKAETWSIEGDLPEGIKFDKGKFSGKPKEVGDFDLTITASNGATEMTQDFTLKVASIPPKFSGSFKTGTEGKYYECKLRAKGSTPIEWEFDSLPDGLTATPDETGETCIISGTPTEVFAQSVAITLTNGDNEGDSITAHKKLTVKAVTPRFETKAKDIPGGTVDETYSYQLMLKANYTPSNVKWTYTGDMPKGLYLDEDSGEIYGVPEKAVKNSKFTVYALNAAKESLKAKLTITMTIKEAEYTRLPVLGESPEGESVTHEFVNGIAYYERGEITDENLANISSSGEVIIATLPAVEVDTEDLYEFTVSVDKSAPEGGVLVWHSFPDGEYYGGDSEEAYFLDSNNTDIKTVPEDYCVTVHAWLKPGVIYEPVIAVKISHND